MFDFLKQLIPQNIDKLEKNKDVNALSEILQTHKDRQVREKAAYALGRIQSEPNKAKAVETLSSFIKNKNEDEGMRAVSAIALGHTTTPEVEKMLIGVLKDKDESEGIRAAIVQALSDFKTHNSVIAMVESLNDLSPKVKSFAGDSLGLSNSVAAHVTNVLFSDNETIRQKSLKELTASENRKALDIFTMVSNAEDNLLRKKAILAMGSFDSPSIIEPLIARLDKEFGENLVALYNALGKVKSEKTIDLLIDGLKKDSPAIKNACVNALCEKRSERAVEKLLGILLNPQEYQEQRMTVAKALGKTKNAAAMDALISVLGTSEDPLRTRIEDSLAEMDHPDLPSRIERLINSDNEVERFSGVKIIIKQKKSGMGASLLPLASDPHPEVRNLTVMGLGSFKEPGITDKLITILTKLDESELIRGSAARSLGRLGEERALQPLLESLTDDSEHIRSCSAVALSNYKKPEVIDALGSTILKDHSETVKCMAIESMGVIRDIRSVDYLKRAELDPISEKIRLSASKVLRSMGK